MPADQFDDDIKDAIRALISEWNIAERRIKKAEQVRANNVVASAIFELRYAGRKIIDVLDSTLESSWKTDQKVRSKVLRDIADATEDCVKAKHDAIDAMINFITTWFDATEKRLSLSEVQKYFPNYTQITSRIYQIQDQIEESRGDRNNLRNKIYDDIENGDYAEILSLYRDMQTSSHRVTAEARKKKRKENFLAALSITGWLISAVSLGYIFW